MQGAKPYAQQDKPCDICGDVGDKDLIVTCSKCLTAREHRYCMKVLAIAVPEFWICEACLSSNVLVSTQSGGEEGLLDPLVVDHNVMHPGTCGKACNDSEWQVCSKKLKLETGKVKFLPAEEAIRLSSETLNMGSPQHNNPGLKYDPSTSIEPMIRRRTSIQHKIVTTKFSILGEKANPNVMSSGFMKPPANIGADISTMIGQHEVKTSKESKEDCDGKQWQGTMYMPAKEDKIFKSKTKEVKTADANSENTMSRESYASATLEPKEIESSNRKIEKAMNDTSPLTVSCICGSGETFHAAEPENFGLEEQDLPNISKLELYHRYRPALEDTWRYANTETQASNTLIMANPLLKILDTHKLTGCNFKVWYRNLRIVLDYEKLGYVLDKPTTKTLFNNTSSEESETFQKWKDDNLKVKSYMLASMNDDLQTQFEDMKDAFDIYRFLVEMFGKSSNMSRYELSTALFAMRLSSGVPPESHLIKMINLIGQLYVLGFSMDFALQTDLILQSLPPIFDQFVINYMNNLELTPPKLMNEINSFYKRTIKGEGKETIFTTVSSGKKSYGLKPKGGVAKKKGKAKDKGKSVVKSQANDECHHCKKLGHWRRNCPLYLESLRKKRAQGLSS